MGRDQGNVPARVKELRHAGVSPHKAHQQAMAEAREASGHNDKSGK
jgi:hypothetical protein